MIYFCSSTSFLSERLDKSERNAMFGRLGNVAAARSNVYNPFSYGCGCLLWPSSSLPNLPFLSTSLPVVYLWKGIGLALTAGIKKLLPSTCELNAIEETQDSYLHLLLFAVTIQEVSNSCGREAASVVRSL